MSKHREWPTSLAFVLRDRASASSSPALGFCVPSPCPPLLSKGPVNTSALCYAGQLGFNQLGNSAAWKEGDIQCCGDSVCEISWGNNLLFITAWRQREAENLGRNHPFGVWGCYSGVYLPGLETRLGVALSSTFFLQQLLHQGPVSLHKMKSCLNSEGPEGAVGRVVFALALYILHQQLALC